MKRITVYVDNVVYRFVYFGSSADAIQRYIELFPQAQRIVAVAK